MSLAGGTMSSLFDSMPKASNQASNPQNQDSFKSSQMGTQAYNTPEQGDNQSPLEKAYGNWNYSNNTIDKWKPRNQVQQQSIPNMPTERPRNNDWLAELLNNNRRGTGWRY